MGKAFGRRRGKGGVNQIRMNEETLWNTSSKLIYVILLFTFNILYIKDKRLNRGAPH